MERQIASRVCVAKEASSEPTTLRQPVCYRDVIIVESAPDPVSRKLPIVPDIGRYGSIPLKPDDQWGLRRGSEQISIIRVTYSNDALERINTGRQGVEGAGSSLDGQRHRRAGPLSGDNGVCSGLSASRSKDSIRASRAAILSQRMTP